VKHRAAITLGLVLLAFGGIFAARSGEPSGMAATGPQEALVLEVRQLRGEIRAVSETLARMEANQQKQQAALDLLLASPWEYRLESTFGGAKREELGKLLEKLGKEKFEYQGQTDDGLYIFRRRVVAE